MKNILILFLLIGFADASIPVIIFNKDMPPSYGYCNDLDGCKYFTRKNPLPFILLPLFLIIIFVLTLKYFYNKILSLDSYKVVNR